MKSNDFRDGIIDMHTRQFGAVAEIIVMILQDCVKSKKLEFDLIDIKNKKIEVKASKVLRKNKLNITKENFYDIIINNSNKNRLLQQKNIHETEFDCNIQQIKTELFDKMIYLLFFKDIIEIFEITKQKIISDKNIYYSDKQHRGNTGEGQFHINNKTYQYHKKHYFIASVTYQELLKQSKQNKY